MVMNWGVKVPGAVFMSHAWWYAFSVLRPAQMLKPLGLYRPLTRDIGRPPSSTIQRGAGQYYCLKERGPILLEHAPVEYHLVEEFDGLSENYDWLVAPFSRPVFDEVMTVLRPLVAPDSRILDCSCGSGTDLLALTALVPQGEVVGSDLAADMVKTASNRAKQEGKRNVAFFQADVAELPRHFAQRFDFTYCALAFHHYPKPLDAVREMHRVLRPGGRAFVIDAGPWWMKALASPLASVGDPGWVAFRTGEEFQSLFLEAGFADFYWTEILPGVGLSIATKSTRKSRANNGGATRSGAIPRRMKATES
jgi:SAM-dependent methyltransferase